MESANLPVQVVTHSGEYLYLESLKCFCEKFHAKGVRKVSWVDGEIHHRFRPKIKCDLWCPSSERKLEELSEAYKVEKDNLAIYWVDQSVMSPLKNAFELSEDEYYASLIRSVYTDEQFKEKYCK